MFAFTRTKTLQENRWQPRKFDCVIIRIKDDKMYKKHNEKKMRGKWEEEQINMKPFFDNRANRNILITVHCITMQITLHFTSVL